MSIIRTGQTTLVELRDLVNFAIIFLYQATLFRWLSSLLQSLIVSLTVLLYLHVLIFVLLLPSLHWEILIRLLSQFQLTFLQTQKVMLLFIVQLMAIFELIGTIFLII